MYLKTVDKRNANDICATTITTTALITTFGNIMDTPTKGNKKKIITVPSTTATTATTMQFNTFNNCDGNRNNDTKYIMQQQQQQQQQRLYNAGKVIRKQTT